jgi:hypothetical protein
MLRDEPLALNDRFVRCRRERAHAMPQTSQTLKQIVTYN